MKNLILKIAILLLAIQSGFSQTNEIGKKYIYEFRDGTTIIGTFDKEENGNIYIKDLEGKEVYIPRVMIAQIHNVTEQNLKGGEYFFPNLHDTRYFFAPTAFGLEEGEGYFNHIYYMFWQAQYGISDDFSIGGGTSFIGLPATLNAKFSFNLNKDFNYAIGYFWIGNLFWGDIGDRTLVSMPFGVLTKGSKENNITFGIGYNLSKNWSSDGDQITFNFGTTLRASRRFSFIAEAWIFDLSVEEPSFMGGPGIRYFRKVNRVTAKNGAGAKVFDFQLLITPDRDGIMPLLGASQKF